MQIAGGDLGQRIDRIQIRTQRTDGDQRIHVGHPMQQRRYTANIEITAHEQDDRRQDQLDERKVQRMCRIVDDVRKRQRDRQHMRHADVEKQCAQHQHEDHAPVAFLFFLRCLLFADHLGLKAAFGDRRKHLALLDPARIIDDMRLFVHQIDAGLFDAVQL